MQTSWTDFLRYYAQKSNKGSIRTLDGIEAAWAHSALLVNNGTYLTKAVTDEADLRARCRDAVNDAAPHTFPWLFFLNESLLPVSLQINEILTEEGFHQAFTMTVMTADQRSLTPPQYKAPSLDIQRVSTTQQQFDALNLNCLAYGMPLEISNSVIDCGVYFTDPQKEFGYVAYSNDKPVSTASVLILEDTLYVELVATDPAHHKKGYAEAVMRHALNEAATETGLSKTALDASAMGRPLYTQMGYQPSTGWQGFIKA